jgi:hypothetical protein
MTAIRNSLAAIAAAALVATPIAVSAAGAASKLSIAKSARVGTVLTKKSSKQEGGSILIVVAAAAAVILGIVLLTDSKSP